MKLFKGILLFLIPLLLIFAVLEAGMRISGKWGNLPYPLERGNFNFEYGWEMDGRYFAFEPGSDVLIECPEFRYEYKVNELGLRERSIMEMDSTALRIFIYGDSFAEGNGAAYDSSWPRRIEELLHMDSIPAQVYMMGVSGSDPFYAFSALEEKLLEFNPTHFIATINDSDFDNYTMRGGFSRFKSDGSTRYRNPPPVYPFYKRSHLARMITHDFLRYNHYLIKDADSAHVLDEAADSLCHALSEVDALCRDHGIRFMGVIHPTPHEVCFELGAYRSDVLSITDDHITFPALRLYNAMRDTLNAENCYEYCWQIDSHFNGDGYRMFGELVYEAIRNDYPDFWNVEP